MLKNPPPGAAQMLQAFGPVMEREVFLLGGESGPVGRRPLEDFFDGLETAEFHSGWIRVPQPRSLSPRGDATGLDRMAVTTSA
jgi:hypothetical protein